MRQQGMVREWRGGFGFITYRDPTGRSRNVFVHFSEILMAGYRQLSPGDLVEFAIEEGPRGTHAVRVEVVQSAETAA
jgi:CspA family cold shock protein